MKKKVLISAHDYGAGINLFPIYNYLLRQVQIEVLCLIGGPSQKIFRLSENSIHISPTGNEGCKIKKLLGEAEKYLSWFNPDVVLTGISGDGIGIEEAVLKIAKGVKK